MSQFMACYIGMRGNSTDASHIFLNWVWHRQACLEPSVNYSGWHLLHYCNATRQSTMTSRRREITAYVQHWHLYQGRQRWPYMSVLTLCRGWQHNFKSFTRLARKVQVSFTETCQPTAVNSKALNRSSPAPQSFYACLQPQEDWQNIVNVSHPADAILNLWQKARMYLQSHSWSLALCG